MFFFLLQPPTIKEEEENVHALLNERLVPEATRNVNIDSVFELNTGYLSYLTCVP